MVDINEILTPGEQVIKKQGGVSYNSPMGPTGDLILTSTRLVFLNKKRWGLISPGALSGQDVQIPLQTIRSVKKGSFGSVVIESDKKHQFMVTIWQSGKWVDTIQQTMGMLQSGAPYQQHQQFRGPMPPPPPPSNTGNYCNTCGRPLEFIQQYGRWYCRTCQRYA